MVCVLPTTFTRQKKTKGERRRARRGDRESDGDHRGDERKNRDVLWDDLPGYESSFADLGQGRQEVMADHLKNLRRIEWLVPGVVWAMDVTEYDLEMAGKIHLHNTQDLGSRYKFPPLSGECPVGEEIAGFLSEKVCRFGPPLFLKRDNGGNLNHGAVK